MTIWNTRENGESRQGHGGGAVAVAVDKGKSSQYAFKWAIDNLFPRNQPLKLVHVVQRSQSNPGNDDIVTQQESDAQALQLLLSYRCYCTRRKVQFETVILHNSDVARALIDYVALGGVETLLLGTLPKNGLSSLRIFKNSDVSSSVLKSAPNFCNVYIIHKGKVSAMRPASRAAQGIHAIDRTQAIYHSVNHHGDSDMLYDEVSVVDNDNSLTRLSTDSDYFSFYENLESGLVGSSSSSDILNDNVEEEVIRHKLELKHAMELYHTSCKEAKNSNQKLNERQDWNMKQEQRLKEAEYENARCKTDIEVAKRLAVQEMENKVLRAEMKAMIAVDERKKVFDALKQSQNFLKYQTVFHSLVVLFLLFMYFSSP